MADKTTLPLQISKVGIIGFGVSGIAAAKQLREYNPVVFEATDSIGGVWKHCCFHSTKLQTPRRGFEFSDYHWTERDNPNFPSHVEILEYLHGYAEHFDLFKFVKFNSKVVEIRYVGDSCSSSSSYGVSIDDFFGPLLPGQPVWEVAVENLTCNTIQVYSFELLVVCIGKYGDVAMMPEFPRNKGRQVYEGKVLHSIDYAKLDKEATTELLKGKKVAIVGYKKSAIELALECADANQGPDGEPCTMVVRTPHWNIPANYRIWGIPFFLFYSTRYSQFLHERPNQSHFESFLRLLLSPMRKAISKLIESYLVWKFPLVKYGLKPDHRFVEDYASCQMAIMPENFFSEVEKGKIQFKRASKWWFWSGGIEFEDNTMLDADLVILATGYNGLQKLKFLLPEPFRSSVADSFGVMPLYRGLIHPLIPNMAFMGYVESGLNLRTSELRSQWLARLAAEHFKLPSPTEMLQHVNAEMEVIKRTTRFYKRHCVSTFSIKHMEDISREMGVQP